MKKSAFSIKILIFLILIISLTPCLNFKGTLYSQNKNKNASPAVSTGTQDQETKKKTATTKSQTNKPPVTPEVKALEDAEKQKKREEKLASNIEKTLRYGISDERKDAMNKILLIKDESLKKKLTGQLVTNLQTETDPEVLIKGVTIAGELKAHEVIPLLTELQSNESEDVKTAAVYALNELKAVSAMGKLIEAIKKQDLTKPSNYTDALLQTLGSFGCSELTDFAMQSISNASTNQNVRENFILFLGKTGSQISVDFLIKTYADDDEPQTIRSYAINSLSKMKAQKALPTIKETLKKIESYSFNKKKNYFNLYLYSIAALARLGDLDALPKLEDALKSNNTQVRLKAISLIKEMNDKRTIDILKYKMEYDPSDKVQKAAKDALKEMGVELPNKSADTKVEKK